MTMTARRPQDRLERRRRLTSLLAAAPTALVATGATADLARIHLENDTGSTVQAPAESPTGLGNEEVAQSWRNY
jgi:hypothetical protein